MSQKRRGGRNDLRPKQKHDALVPIKSVYSNFLLEQDKTRRVKIITGEQQQSSKRLETRAEEMIESQFKTSTPNKHLQKRLERAFNVLSVQYTDINPAETRDEQLLLYGMKPASKTKTSPINLSTGGKSKKINSKLEFDGCIFNTKTAEVEEKKKRKPFSAFGLRSKEPHQMYGNKTKLYGEDVIITQTDNTTAVPPPGNHGNVAVPCSNCHATQCVCTSTTVDVVVEPALCGNKSASPPGSCSRKYSIFKSGVFKPQTPLSVVGVQRVLSPPSTCTFVKKTNRRHTDWKGVE